MSRDYSKQILLVCAVSALAMLGGCSMVVKPGTGSADITVADDVPAGVRKDFQRAVGKLQAGDDSGAATELERFIQRHPGYANAYVNLAIVRDRQNDREGALLLLAKAIELDADNVYALNRRGLIKREQGDFAGAAAAWEQATGAQPAYPNAWYNLGVLHELYLQDLPTALAHYQRYQELTGSSDGDQVVARWIADLERRIGNPAQSAQAMESL